MSCITIRNCCIGEGKPNVIIPIVEHTEAAILQMAAEFSTPSADCVEWRVDLFELAKDLRAVDPDSSFLPDAASVLICGPQYWSLCMY